MRHFIKAISILVFVGLIPSWVFSQTVAVELEKMNVFYVGVDNPIRIAVSNYPCDRIIIKATYGTVNTTIDKCHYLYKIDSCWTFREQIFIGVQEKNTIKWLDTIDYRIKKTQTPRILIAGHYRGLIKKDKFVNSVIIPHLEGFDYDHNAKVIKYSYEIWRKDSLICSEKDIKGFNFTSRLNSEIVKSQKGDRYVFFDVSAETEVDKCIRDLDSTEYEIE